MSVIIALAALGLLMLAAYRGYSVILFAPSPPSAPSCSPIPARSRRPSPGCSWRRWSVSSSFTSVFLLGAVFGKLIELAGFSRSIVAAAIRLLGTRQAMLVIVLVCALLTYGGVSLFVVVFAVYPFAAEMFRQSDIPKRLIPATIALGAFSFTMDALPGTRRSEHHPLDLLRHPRLGRALAPAPRRAVRLRRGHALPATPGEQGAAQRRRLRQRPAQRAGDRR